MKHLLFIALTLPLIANAQGVIYDSGKTVDAMKYRLDIGNPTPIKNKPSIAKLVSPKTPEMSLGRVKKRKVNLPYLPTPFFLLGTDSTSIAWVRKHSKALQKAGAKGLIVNSSSPQGLKLAMQAARGLDISPASGSELAKRFNLKHYPVLITRNQIAQ